MQAQYASDKPSREASQFLTFYLGGEAFGVDILKVQEIRGWEKVRPLPDLPAYVKGVLDLRGTIVPIVDLRVRFGNPDPVYESTTVVIIVSVQSTADEEQLIGMVVDGVSDVLDTSRIEIKPPPRSVAGVAGRYLAGMVSLEQGMVVLVNVDRILSEQEFSAAFDGQS